MLINVKNRSLKFVQIPLIKANRYILTCNFHVHVHVQYYMYMYMYVTIYVHV